MWGRTGGHESFRKYQPNQTMSVEPNVTHRYGSWFDIKFLEAILIIFLGFIEAVCADAEAKIDIVTNFVKTCQV